MEVVGNIGPPLLSPFFLRRFHTTMALAASSDQVKEQEDYEFEDPIEAWIDLCEACRIMNVDTRRSEMGALLFKAKNSHWTHKLMEAQMIQDAEDAEADYQGHDTQPYSGGEEQDGSEPGGDYTEDMALNC